MRFGFWPCPWLPFTEVIELCAHAEVTGWDGVWVADHFMAPGPTPRPFPEAWTALSANRRPGRPGAPYAREKWGLGFRRL